MEIEEVDSFGDLTPVKAPSQSDLSILFETYNILQLRVLTTAKTIKKATKFT